MSRDQREITRMNEKDSLNIPDGQWSRTRESIRRISISLWLWELMGLLTSASCIGAIMIILAHYNGRPVPTWTYGLTINGVVSILAGIAKGSVILPIAEAISQLKWCWFWGRQRSVVDFETFDSASRGPWGSLTLLSQPRMFNLASLGAALTVAALAVEPSLQQIPAYPLSTVNSDAAFIPRSTFFSELDRGEATDWRGVSTVISSGLRGAVYSGIFGSDPVGTTLRTTCPSGNCTWPTFASIGVCNMCQNISSSLYFNRTFTGSSGTKERLPNGMRVDTIGASGTAWMSTSVYESTAFNQKLADQSILDLTIIALPPLSETAAPNASATAFECVLYPCVKWYNASMINGRYDETVTASWPEPNTTIEDNPKLGTVFGCVGGGWYRLYELCNLNTTADSLNGNVTLHPPGQNESFAIKLDTYNLLRTWLGTKLTMAYTSGFAGVSSSDISQALYVSLLNTSQIRVVNNTEGIAVQSPKPMMDRIATSMTNYMRNAADKESAAVGTAFRVQTIVRARWAWAVFPVALLATTIGFLMSAVIVSIEAQVPIWKSSSLASLLHGLDDNSCQAITASRFDHVETNARGFVMSMEPDGNSRWRLKGAKK